MLRRGWWLPLVLPVIAGARPEATPVRLTNDGLDKQRPAWAADGKSLAFSRHERGGTQIHQYVMTFDPKPDERRLTKRREPEYNGVFTPDGKSLIVAVITLSGTQGNLDLARFDVDGRNQKGLVGDVTGRLSHQDWPSPSPDGKRIAFQSTHDGNQEIYTCDSEGNDVRRVTQNPGHDAHPCWTPDGSRIVFTTDRWGGLELASCSPDGGDARRLTESAGLDDYPAVSPDGKRIAFVSNHDGDYEIYVAAIDGSTPVNVTAHVARDTFPTWTPDSKGITFVSDRDGGGDLYTVEAP